MLFNDSAERASKSSNSRYDGSVISAPCYERLYFQGKWTIKDTYESENNSKLSEQDKYISRVNDAIGLYIVPEYCENKRITSLEARQGVPSVNLDNLGDGISNSIAPVSVCSNKCEEWSVYVSSFKYTRVGLESYFVIVTGNKDRSNEIQIDSQSVNEVAELIQEKLKTN